jgi:hypothetical protein
MPEAGGSTIEVAHHLSEHKPPRQSVSHAALEILEGLGLALVAITTAWGGYQAALWTGRQAELYGLSSKLRIQAEGLATAANQERLYNASAVAEWLKAEAGGQKKLADLFQRRILPEFRPAFDAWKITDPLNNPNAPPGPFSMPVYHSSKADEATRLNAEASEKFELGNQARQHADKFVQVTVILATVLLLISASQRFKIHRVRVGLAVIAFLILCLTLYRIVSLPRV